MLAGKANAEEIRRPFGVSLGETTHPGHGQRARAEGRPEGAHEPTQGNLKSHTSPRRGSLGKGFIVSAFFLIAGGNHPPPRGERVASLHGNCRLSSRGVPPISSTARIDRFDHLSEVRGEDSGKHTNSRVE